MKTTKQHFEIFKKECKKWQEVLSLDNCNLYFQHIDLGESDATCLRTTDGRMTLSLSTELLDEIDYDMPITNYIKKLAKHEMIHALLAQLALSITRDEVLRHEAEELLVHKLEKIIQ